MLRRLLIISILAVLVLASAWAGIDLTENSIIIADMSTSRIIRVTDLTAAGWQEGPSIAGLALNHP
jgi:hypothetical protein